MAEAGAAPAAGTPGNGAGAAPAGDVGAQSAKVAKPIADAKPKAKPAKRALPPGFKGIPVAPDSDFAKDWRSEQGIEDAGEAAPEPKRAAEPDAPEQPVEPPTEPTEPEGAEEFEFAGKKHKDKAAAEQAFRQAEGRAKAAEKRAQEAAAKHEQELAAINEINERWQKTWDEAVAAKLAPEGVRPGQKQPASAQPQAPDATPFVDTLTQDQWTRLDTLAKEKGLPYALATLSHQMDKHVQGLIKSHLEALRGELNPMLTPVFEQYKTQNNRTRAAEFFSTEVAQYTDDAGAPLFPELVNDPQAAQEVSQFWLALGDKFGREVALDPSGYGVRLAYRDWKDWKAQQKQVVDDAASTAETVVRKLDEGRAAAALGSVSSPSAVAPPTEPSKDHSAKRSLRAGSTERFSSTGINLGRF